jgi:cytochrome P450
MAGKVQKIDLSSQAFARDPFPTYARLREAGPVLQTRLPLVGKTWVATTHQAASEVLKDDETFVMEAKKVGKTLFSGIFRLLPRLVRVFSDSMLGHDNPDHRRLRRLVEQAFSRHSVENLRSRIGVLCDGLLVSLAGRETVDLLAEWARPLPVAVICELLGLPDEDRLTFTRWVKALFSSMSLFGMLLALPSLFRLLKYLQRHFEQCRQLPRPGLMTALVQVEEDGDKLSEDELLAMAFLLLFAGFETTVHLLSGGTLALLKAPEQKERLLNDWSLSPPAVEELLRFVSPVQMSEGRYVIRDLEFHGQSLRRGDRMVAWLGAANADPARFPDPGKLDLSRSPNPHVSFGSGIHFCLGAQLARIEAQVGFERLFTRYPRLALAVADSELKYSGNMLLRALVALPVRLQEDRRDRFTSELTIAKLW